jgi:hypothetical protein
MAAMGLIVIGILALVYGGFSYTKDTHDAKIGPLELSLKDKERVNIPGLGRRRGDRDWRRPDSGPPGALNKLLRVAEDRTMEVTMLKNYRWLPPVLLAIGVLVATPACVASIHSARIDYRQGVQQRAYEQGHRKGFDRGRDDARHGRPQQYEQYKEYRNADDGYRRDDGDRDSYRGVFRQGFRDGYAQAFKERGDRNDRYWRR